MKMHLILCAVQLFTLYVTGLYSCYDHQVQLVTFGAVASNCSCQLHSHNQVDVQYASELEIS